MDLELTLERVAHGGHCVARHEGRVVFVRHGIPGERVIARVDAGEDTKRFWKASVVKVLEASPDRVKHIWNMADALAAEEHGAHPVGGAEFGHISLARQRSLKAEVFREQLTRLAQTDPDSVGFHEVESVPVAGWDESESAREDDGLAWRSRASFSVTKDGRLAMHPFHSNELVPIAEMPLAAEAINNLKLWETDFRGFERIEVAAPSTGQAPLLVLIPRADNRTFRPPHGEAIENASGVVVVEQTRGSAGDGRGSLRTLAGKPYVMEQAGRRALRVTGEGFWQIHRGAPRVLTEAMLDYARPEAGETVADLYAGAGLFTAALADAVGSRGAVLSIEGAPGTSADAAYNFEADSQVYVTRGRVERTLAYETRGDSLDAIVLDPPRVGAGKQSVQAMAQTNAQRIAYVSCDPASFARDVGYFKNHGYELRNARVFDLYPHTHHMEIVGLLAKNEG
ncbi:class I SAM-dependent RNA methyltransferase [Neomicrococcus aestuarii]|uniref:TRAM domain-containing protein n=1 Tax=Neomicrococcus aestuarii TaxID=556325 RepID=A0A1L2ZK63_9MICC|nr:hypothetical protein BHE16_00695 [Neomicrococcus aestuarii]